MDLLLRKSGTRYSATNHEYSESARNTESKYV